MTSAFLPRKRRLGELLSEAGMVDELQLRAALAEQKKWGGKLGRTLVEMGFLDEQSIVLALSTQLGLPPVDLDSVSLPANVGSNLRLDVVERYGVFPLGVDPQHKVLHVASSDPTNVEALQEITFHTGMKLRISVATASSIDRAIRRYYYGESTEGSPTATPASFGITNERTFDFTGGAQTSNSASVGPTTAELMHRLEEMNQRMVALEKLAASQVKAMRGMLEVMVEKGLMSREEFLAKVRGFRRE